FVTSKLSAEHKLRHNHFPNISVKMANESLPSIWRLREMQQLIDVLRRDTTRLLGVRDLVGMMNAIPSNRWTDLIAEGV
ncbi:hypothetical protein ACC710_37740, partial [Rhizobium ruizarguesonis]